MKELAFANAAIALAAGLGAQILAVHLALPGIVLLLAAGTLLGPDVLGWLDPKAFGAGRADLVTLVVIVILFEGALALDLKRLREQQRSLLLLLTGGAAISMAAGSLAAWSILGLSPPVALLYGSLMIVTGPTVVKPLLSRIKLARRVRELLVSEGVLIDPIGAIVALVAAEWVVGRHGLFVSGGIVIYRLLLGSAIGFAAGFVLAEILKRQERAEGTEADERPPRAQERSGNTTWLARRRAWRPGVVIPEELVNPAVLAVVVVVAAVASRISAEAGLMAAVAQGVTMANRSVPGLGRLREFKETLTVILLSFLFVVLAADLRVAEVTALGWEALAVVAIVIWVGRPLAVFSSTVGSDLKTPERLFVAWICPRGIVAAAVAGFFRIALDEAGIPGGASLEALVFVTVAVTVVLQGMTARPLARLLGIDFPKLEDIVIVGAGPFPRTLAGILNAQVRPVTLLHQDKAAIPKGPQQFPGPGKKKRRTPPPARIRALVGDALKPEFLGSAGVPYADTVVAMTTNSSLNDLVGKKVREHFPMVERVLEAGEDRSREGADSRRLFPGNFRGMKKTNELAETDALLVESYTVTTSDRIGEPLAALPYAPGEFAVAVKRANSVLVATGSERLALGDQVWCARRSGSDSEVAGALSAPVDTGADGI